MLLLQKLFRFGIVGTLGLCIDFFTTWLCKEKFRLNKYIANTAGFSLAVCSNFYLNYVWTFKNSSNNTMIAFSSFVAIALVGLALNNGIVYLFTELMKVNFYKAKISAVAIVFLWNFGANYMFTFHS